MSASTKKPTQEQRILALLESSWPNWVPSVALSRISLGYPARIWSLRRKGWLISNRVQFHDGLSKHGFYKLGSPPIPSNRERRASQQRNADLFGDLTPDRSYRE